MRNNDKYGRHVFFFFFWFQSNQGIQTNVHPKNIKDTVSFM